MPRLKSNAAPSYRLHKQSGQALVTLNGKDILLGKHDTPASREAYDRIIGEWIANGRQLPAAPADLTVAELVARFWTHAQRTYRDVDGNPTTELESFRHSLQPLLDLYASTQAAKFSPLCLRAVRERMIAKGNCRKVINRRIGRVRHVSKWASSYELIPPHVHHALRDVEGLRRGRSEARETDPVKPAPEPLVEGLLNSLSPTLRAMVELHLLTGMRSAELCAMRGRDFDTTTDKTGRIWFYRPPKHKTAHHGYERIVYLGQRAREIIAPYLKPDLQAFLFSPADAERDRRAALTKARKTPLSCGNKPGSNVQRRPERKPGDKYTSRTYATAILRACRRAFPVPGDLFHPVDLIGPLAKAEAAALAAKRNAWQQAHHIHPHQFRHNAGTRLREQYGLEAAQVLLGQETLSVTELYAEKNVKAAMRIVSEVG